MSNQYHSGQKSSLTEILIDTEQNQQIRRSQLQLIFRRFQKNRLGCIGLLGVCIFILLSVGAPFFAPYDHVEQDYQRSYLHLNPYTSLIRMIDFILFHSLISTKK